MSRPPEPVDPPGPPIDDPTGEASDEQLLATAASGEPAALGLLYGRYRAFAYALALRIVQEPAVAEDVVQDAFMGVWRNAGRYSPARASARTWILAIVHHRAIDAVRRRRPTAELPDSDVMPPTLVTPDVWPEVSGRLDAEVVRRGLATLSDVQREAIELAYFGGLTQLEIAARTDTPLGTVKSRVRLGLLALRRELSGATEVLPDGPAAGSLVNGPGGGSGLEPEMGR
jgi:RNA polymerase sigma-70 factor (ECF subfamily)